MVFVWARRTKFSGFLLLLFGPGGPSFLFFVVVVVGFLPSFMAISTFSNFLERERKSVPTVL